MVVLEAMAASRPVVVTDAGDNRHVIEPGRSGLVVAPGDSGSLAQALLRLIHSSELRTQFGNAARARFESNYAARKMAEKYEDMYTRLLS